MGGHRIGKVAVEVTIESKNNFSYYSTTKLRVNIMQKVLATRSTL